ncbi:hypothetical protein PSTT_04332 [Puccinia striiformis]|uniref:DDE-1 domain-containing protein n=1 Tax=Puccinia striiformis TaxID=27350 RepID=A0A2S4VT96_9BASI|nr:hypothetical protein PSTT_04332 [Puccinia striiformis]
MKEGKLLTDKEEEWLDSEGNLIDGVLLMDKICLLPSPSGTKVLALKSTEIKTFLQILEFCFQLAATEEKKASENKRVKNIQAPKNRPNNVDKSKKPASKAADKPVRPKPVHAKPATKAEESKKQKQKEETSTTSKISNASHAEKVKVLDWHHKNRKNQLKTAVHFADIYPHWKIKQPLISKWLKDEESIQSKDISKSNPSSKQIRSEKWKDFARLARIPLDKWLTLSSGWLDSFKARHQIRAYRRHGKAAGVDIDSVESEVKRVNDLTSKFELKNIFNMDETGLFFSMPPDTGLAFTRAHGQKESSAFHWKSTTTTLFPEEDASDYNYQYAFNAKAWMMGDILQNWLRTWNAKLREEKRHILLLLDNFSGHQVPEDGMSNIQVEFFSPNLTSHVQPLDVGIIKYFQEIPVKELFQINQLTAMKMAKKAWESVSESTIQNCWGKTGITQQNLEGCAEKVKKTIGEAKLLLEIQLNTLEAIGAVLPVNRMSIKNLLDPEDQNKPEELPVVCLTKKKMVAIISEALSYLHNNDNPDANELSTLLKKYQQNILTEIHFHGRQANIVDYFKAAQ